MFLILEKMTKSRIDQVTWQMGLSENILDTDQILSSPERERERERFDFYAEDDAFRLWPNLPTCPLKSVWTAKLRSCRTNLGYYVTRYQATERERERERDDMTWHDKIFNDESNE